MASPEQRGFVERGANISKKIDLGTMVVGALMGNASVVALGAVGYFAGNAVEKKMKQRRTH